VAFLESGYLVFTKRGALVARAFDAGTGRLGDETVPIAPNVHFTLASGVASFAASPSGTIVYQAHRDRSRLTWLDRAGRVVGQVGPAGDYQYLRLSRTGQTALVSRVRATTGLPGIWSIDLNDGRETPLSPDETVAESRPLERPGTREIVFATPEGSGSRIYRRNLATGATALITQGSAFQIPVDVSPDGTRLAFVEFDARGKEHLWSVALDEPGAPVEIGRTHGSEAALRYAPDGRHYLFRSGDPGNPKVFAAALSGGMTLPVTDVSAGLARWSRDGREIIYLSSDRRVVAVPNQTSPTLRPGTPVTLFSSDRYWADLDISADGTRLLAIVPEVVADRQPLTAILHWAGRRP
jgi:Tol biopolymer transport system component